jgi:conjugative relaxase-like TrwC/TraI family protein
MALGVHRLTSNRADYYLSDLARELPVPLAPGQGRGVWVGHTAEGLGLQGSMDPSQFRSVLDGRHPETGRSMRSGRATVLGLDLTFTAPKSVSVMFALGGGPVARHVMEAHGNAVGAAVGYLERHGVSATRGAGVTRQIVPTTGMVAGSFTHGVNRNLDPHLHSHVVMANLVHGTDGYWSACDGRGISAHRQAAGAMYDAQLRAALAAHLGVRWTQSPHGRAEIVGVSPLLLGEFSSRSADIRRHMNEMGTHSSRGNRVAWAVTRPAKGAGSSFGELAVDWERRGLAHGIHRSELGAALGHPSPTQPSFHEHHFASALSVTPHGGAHRRDVVAAFGGAARDGIGAAALERVTDWWVAPSVHQVGVDESLHQRRAVVPSGHLLRALGPRPVDLTDHAVWREAACAIDAYRQRWGVTHSAAPLGVDDAGGELSTFTTTRLIDHLRTANQVETARARLGQREPLVMELDRSR